MIEVFAEMACPFTHVALRRIVAHRGERDDPQPPLWVRAWPLELVNGEPMDPQKVAHEVDALRAQVAPDLFAGFDAASFPATSMPAFELVAAAADVDATTHERVALALRDALFERGRDIADPAVLRDIAQAHAVPWPREGLREAVARDYRVGKERGVQGSPHFFVGDESAFCPMLQIEERDDGLHVGVDDDAVRELLDRWFDKAAAHA